MNDILNRKAKFEYHFLQKLEAGMMLTGTEVKSLRLGNGNITDAYCVFNGDELFLKSLYIAEYPNAGSTQHETRRDRKLLLKKAELRKWQRKVREKGLTIVPVRIFFAKSGYAKCEIALAQGKKSYDKRQTIKDRDVERDLARTRLS